jgi:gliding motility-associated-like protein
MKSPSFILLLILLMPSRVFATHNRAGQITFTHISGYTYSVTVTTFTYTLSAADRSELLVDWGDNSSTYVARNEAVFLPNNYKHNTYTTTHTFPGPGVYQIVMQDPNRNYGIINIPNSVNVIFSIKTTLVVNPDIGQNSAPQLLTFPIDKAALGHIFIHNPSAYDPDGDSLSYKMAICTGQNGKPISDYTLPAASDTIYVNPITGDLVWDAPVQVGKYNVAMNIEEWRRGVKIGNITRDMQIEVYETNNHPPVNPPLKNLCVEAGTLIEFQVTTTDADHDVVNQSMTGGPLQTLTSPATFTKVANDHGFSTSTFRWQTTCDHIRRQPWQLVLKSEDVNSDISLVDMDNFTIKVLAPAPKNLTALSSSTEIALSWKKCSCGNVAGYYIYRHEGSTSYVNDSCETGVPSYTGFKLIGKISSPNDTAYSDDNNGEGLVQGINYCYRVTACYGDGSESHSSQEICSSLVPGFPSLLNASVTKIGSTDGSVYLAWSKPRNFDKAIAPGPYVFRIYRARTNVPAEFQLIDSVLTVDLNDTSYIDAPLNTELFPYYYTVKMINNSPGNRFEMRPGESEIASTLYLDIAPNDNQLTLNIHKKAPWTNDEYVIYRKYGLRDYDSIGVTDNYQFVDRGLKNGETFYYKVKSIGWRPIDGVTFNTSNLSHENFGTPVDHTAPCAPDLFVESRCDSLVNILRWTNPNKSCANDVVRYNIYYATDLNAALDSLTSISPATDTVYIHQPTSGTSLAGCYAVAAVDSFGNKSAMLSRICVDQCSMYSLPNVFTPNGDNLNDIYVSNNLNHVIEKVDMRIFNRYGQLVYDTHDPDINWKGYYRETNTKLPSGVYYYICDVYEPRIGGVSIRTLTGFIHLFAEGHAETITK